MALIQNLNLRHDKHITVQANPGKLNVHVGMALQKITETCPSNTCNGGERIQKRK